MVKIWNTSKNVPPPRRGGWEVEGSPIKNMNILRTGLIAIGWATWFLGNIYLINGITTTGFVLSLIGLALSMGGFAIWAELKGRSPAWMALAILSPIGILPMLFLKTKVKKTL